MDGSGLFCPVKRGSKIVSVWCDSQSLHFLESKDAVTFRSFLLLFKRKNILVTNIIHFHYSAILIKYTFCKFQKS